MDENSADTELLAEWVRHHREPAFRALVARYAGLVHMSARRMCGDDALAADASQLVFILLARKARSLSAHTSLAGWLHVTAVRKTRDLIDKARRENRKRRLLQAAMATELSHASNDAWLEMQPVLDDALAALSDKDREALLLRFYRSLSVREIAATLGIATDAAQKRIDRATERLRGKLARRGCPDRWLSIRRACSPASPPMRRPCFPFPCSPPRRSLRGLSAHSSLSAIITSLAALMKSTSLIPPLVALIVAGAWTGTKYQPLSSRGSEERTLAGRNRRRASVQNIRHRSN